MSNLPQQNTLNQYVADGITTTYTYSFLILEADSLANDIAVYVTPAGQTPNPSSDIQPLNTNYTVTGVGVLTGGTIVFQPGFIPPISSIVTIVRQMSVSIDTQFVDARNFNGANLDNAFERVVLIMQQLNTYFMHNALSYIINTYLPVIGSNFLPPLPNNNVWVGQNGQVIAALIENDPDISLLRSQLASQAPGGGDGASLIGFYNNQNNIAQNLNTFLNNLPTFLANFSSSFALDTGIVNVLVANNTLGSQALFTGLTVFVKVANTNTGPATLNYNGFGAIAITVNGIPAIAGNMTANQIYELSYDGSAWELLNAFIPLATNVQALGGTDAVHPVTSAGLASNKLLATNGYMALPGGMIMQWGVTASVPNQTSTTVTFPLAFPVGCFNAQATIQNTTSGVTTGTAVSTLGATTMLVYNNSSGAASSSTSPIFWTAIGH